MKIALYVPSWPPGFIANGIVTYASHIVPVLRQLGHEVFVITPFKMVDGDDPYTIDLRRYATPATFWDRAISRFIPEIAGFNIASSAITTAVSELVKIHKLDVIEIEETFGLSFSISRLQLLPVVVRLHGPWFLTGDVGNPEVGKALDRRRIKWEGRAIHHAQFVTAPSVAVLQAVKKRYNLSLTASQVVPNPLDAVEEAEIWDVKSCDINRILFVGRFDAMKGGDLVLRAFAGLVASNPQLRLTFVGPDNGIMAADGKTQAFEQFMRSSLPEWLRPRIEFRGSISQSNVMRLRPKHFATIVASRHETFSYLVLEAMALGCPLVATAVGGIPELIADKRNGLLVPTQDAKAMTAACQTLLNDHALATRLGRQAWRDCREGYRPDKIANETISAYEQAITNFKASRPFPIDEPRG